LPGCLTGCSVGEPQEDENGDREAHLSGEIAEAR
jgi:hypothetical protein